MVTVEAREETLPLVRFFAVEHSGTFAAILLPRLTIFWAAFSAQQHMRSGGASWVASGFGTVITNMVRGWPSFMLC